MNGTITRFQQSRHLQPDGALPSSRTCGSLSNNGGIHRSDNAPDPQQHDRRASRHRDHLLSRCLIEQNVITGNRYMGIWLSAGGAMVLGNVIVGNGSFGLGP